MNPNSRPQWEAGTLSSADLKQIVVDALADIWADAYRRENPTFQRNAFREIVQDAIYLATNEGMVVR